MRDFKLRRGQIYKVKVSENLIQYYKRYSESCKYFGYDLIKRWRDSSNNSYEDNWFINTELSRRTSRRVLMFVHESRFIFNDYPSLGKFGDILFDDIKDSGIDPEIRLIKVGNAKAPREEPFSGTSEFIDNEFNLNLIGL